MAEKKRRRVAYVLAAVVLASILAVGITRWARRRWRDPSTISLAVSPDRKSLQATVNGKPLWTLEYGRDLAADNLRRMLPHAPFRKIHRFTIKGDKVFVAFGRDGEPEVDLRTGTVIGIWS